MTSVEAQALHRDQLGSVRAVTTFKALTGEPVGNRRVEAAIYKPFGEQTETLRPTQVNQEQKGWIGQRYDADAGLQYLNARYYDPEYGFFLQPDWFEVKAAGVGTNRYGYSFNDPVNMRDPGGNSWLDRGWDAVFGEGSFNSAFGDSGSAWSDRTFGDQAERAVANAYQSDFDRGNQVSSYNDTKEAFFSNGVAANGDEFVVDVAMVGSGAGLAVKTGQLAGKWIAAGIVGPRVLGKYVVYQGVNPLTRIVEYVGITSRDLAVRQAEHLVSGTAKALLDYEVVRGATSLTKLGARIMEQGLINQYGLLRNGGTLLNRINSIAPKYWSQHGIVP